MEPLQRLPRFLGLEAVERLKTKTALVVGCGALGSASASYLVRAGIGRLRLVDFDVVHETNLGDQCLYTCDDAAGLVPKVEAAARQLARFNPAVEIDVVVGMFDRQTASDCLAEVDVVVDGADNLETKYLLNDAAIAKEIPWIYGGCAGSHGCTLTVIPGVTPCLRCVWPIPPSIASASTCSSVGLLPTTPGFIAAVQATEALKILCGRAEEVFARPRLVDIWWGSTREFDVPAAVNRNCPACGQRRFVYLDGTEEVPEVPLRLGLGLGL